MSPMKWSAVYIYENGGQALQPVVREQTVRIRRGSPRWVPVLDLPTLIVGEWKDGPPHYVGRVKYIIYVWV